MEEFQGNPEPASDIYALGTSMIFTLSRKDPLEITDGLSTRKFRKHMSISDALHKILMKMVPPELKNR